MSAASVAESNNFTGFIPILRTETAAEIQRLQTPMSYNEAEKKLEEVSQQLIRSDEFPMGNLVLRKGSLVLLNVPFSGGEQPIACIERFGYGYTINYYT